MTALAPTVDLPALGANGLFVSHIPLPVTDVAGAVVAELSLVPSLFVNRTLAALRKATTVPADERVGMLTKAADLFEHATIAGHTPADYAYAVSRVGGLPITTVEHTVGTLANRLRLAHYTVQHARPAGAVTDWRDPLTRSGRAVWTRRGDVFAVLAAGNHPGAHSLWPEALALGYRVAVRPSQREPFTPHRLILALRAAGFGDDQVALLPTNHDGADAIVRGADLGLAYGGADVVAKYGRDPRVVTQGPGRSKLLITRDADWREHLDTIVDSIAGHGGVGCVNATTVLVEGDPAPLCAALAERLSALPSLPPEHADAVLPVQPLATAKTFAVYLDAAAANAKAWLGGDGIVDALGDGSAVLRPAVHELERADAPQAACELPFPCVWVAPWTRADGAAALRDTLVLTVCTDDDALVDALVEEPTIANVYVGDERTLHMAPELPHDGYLAEFLMRTKSVIRRP
ncbi:aldehyde dehydrogenase family protein [Solirubrobacter phytolaccae]|uniref:Aldehyde dehydrogenase family protein n=1 Tax=Solirubrobacter phytolaccae TaxID=1404360 RepID=A0A9X3SBQ0_9ACTN|nr:aldehyde dehydrogenase family protein [Solirubrobacter phytolaccae]MDA0181685.1 aldehyde dehydrogenase family protein [Solirubrobacter phytolaccae]